jgi:hypothetical protein
VLGSVEVLGSDEDTLLEEVLVDLISAKVWGLRVRTKSSSSFHISSHAVAVGAAASGPPKTSTHGSSVSLGDDHFGDLMSDSKYEKRVI